MSISENEDSYLNKWKNSKSDALNTLAVSSFGSSAKKDNLAEKAITTGWRVS